MRLLRRNLDRMGFSSSVFHGSMDLSAALSCSRYARAAGGGRAIAELAVNRPPSLDRPTSCSSRGLLRRHADADAVAAAGCKIGRYRLHVLPYPCIFVSHLMLMASKYVSTVWMVGSILGIPEFS